MYALEKYQTCGSQSAFYTLKGKKKIGFKTFYSQEDAEEARKVQEILAEYNLAPSVHSEVGRIRIGKNRKQFSDWGYLTEIAEMLACPGNECDCGECEDVEAELSAEIEELVDEIQDAGYYFSDCHIGNVGYITRNGFRLLVCIDTGPESVSSLDDDYYGDNDEYVTGCMCVDCKRNRGEI
jgi:hypothetical protein